MSYTEVKITNGKNYYYRVLSVRNENKISKKRIYLGRELSGQDLLNKEKFADDKLLSERSKKKNKEFEKMKQKIVQVLKRNNIKRAGVFGSYVRGEQKKGSDIDILIEPPKGLGFGFVTLVYDLEKKTGRRVDLLTYKGINPRLKEQILAEELRIL